MCSVWISEQAAIISILRIKWFVFITETKCVYCVVRTETLNSVGFVLFFFDCCMAPACNPGGPVSIPGQSLWDMWCERWHWNRVFSECSDLFLSARFQQWSILITTCVLPLPGGRTGETWEPSKPQCCFGSRGALARKLRPFSLNFHPWRVSAARVTISAATVLRVWIRDLTDSKPDQCRNCFFFLVYRNFSR